MDEVSGEAPKRKRGRPRKACKAEAEAKPKGKAGRPSSYTVELGEKICSKIALRVPLSKICAEPGMPCEWTVWQWKLRYPEFAKNLAQARRHRAESRSDYIDDLVEQVRLGKLDPHSARVMIDAEKWQASKEDPGRYSDRVEVTGKDGGPVAVSVTDDAAMIRTARWVADLLLRANEAPTALLQNGEAAEILLPAPNGASS